jgi:predicted PurR-regulated permease PerM
MKQTLKYTGYILLIAASLFLIYKFWFMIVWVLLAAVLSFIGHPMVNFFDKLHIKKWKFPRGLSALLALLIIVLFFAGFIAIFVPLILNQSDSISKINVDELAQNLQGPIQWLDGKLHSLGVIPAGQSIQNFIILKAKSVVNLDSISNLINSFFGVAGTIIVGLFSVLFIAFFFLKDDNMFEDSLLLLIPEKHHVATRKVLKDSKSLLVRYFIGVLLEVLCVMLLIATGLWIFGVENALLIGFFGGIMNIIPYIGPIIGSILGIILGLTATLAGGTYNEMMPVFLKLGGVFLVANFIDNNILVPYIYSKSVKSHPLEIFFMIIIGGTLAGLPGMLVAIPVYTILRVIGKEFFQQFRVVKKLTESMK